MADAEDRPVPFGDRFAREARIAPRFQLFDQEQRPPAIRLPSASFADERGADRGDPQLLGDRPVRPLQLPGGVRRQGGPAGVAPAVEAEVDGGELSVREEERGSEVPEPELRVPDDVEPHVGGREPVLFEVLEGFAALAPARDEEVDRDERGELPDDPGDDRDHGQSVDEPLGSRPGDPDGFLRVELRRETGLARHGAGDAVAGEEGRETQEGREAAGRGSAVQGRGENR